MGLRDTGEIARDSPLGPAIAVVTSKTPGKRSMIRIGKNPDMRCSLSSEIIGNGHHFVGSLNRLGVNLVTSLSDDHIDHFFGEVDIRALQKPLLDRAESGGEAACPLRRRA